MKVALLAVTVLVAVVVTGAIALTVIKGSGAPQEEEPEATSTTSSPGSGSSSSTPGQPTSTGATNEEPEHPSSTTTNSVYTTTNQPSNEIVLSSGSNMTIWDLYYSVESIIIAPYYSSDLDTLVDWPVLINGTLYGVSDIVVSYRITISDSFNATLNMTWSLLPNQTFTALCTDLDGNIISQETFYNVFAVSHTMTWTGGREFTYTAYLINTSALYWYHTMPPMDVPDYGAWKMGVLGGSLHSDTGFLTWSCAAAKAPMDPELIMNCNPYIEESGDVWAVFEDSVFQRINDEGIAFILRYLSPPELFDRDFLQILPTVTDTTQGWIPSGVPDYNGIEYSLSYLGKIALPGEGVQVDAWRLDFQTDPLYLNGSYILTASTITPLWYQVTVAPPDGPQFTIEYSLVSISILETLNSPLDAYTWSP